MKLRKVSTQKIKQSGSRLKSGDSWRTDKPSSTARGYGYRWQCERADYLRESPLCVDCYSIGIVTASCIVDHVEPHCGNTVLFWDRNNWQALCVNCHNSKKQRAERAMTYDRRGPATS